MLHTTFGMGKVVATSGDGDDAEADVDFGSAGVKRLSLRHAPLEKLWRSSAVEARRLSAAGSRP